MTYLMELDTFRPEVALNVGGAFGVYPKTHGTGAQVSGTVSYTVHKPNGEQVASGTATPFDAGTPPVSVVSFVIGAGVAAELGEDYSVRWTWSDGSVSHPEVTLFDVVRVPYGGSVSLNEMMEERPDIDRVLGRIASMLELPDAATAARVFAMRARGELDAMVRSAATELGTIRPALILDRFQLQRVERKLACREVFGSIAKDPTEGEDEASTLYRYFDQAAQSAWRSMGPIKYDADEDLVPETTVRPGAASVVTRRVQGGR